MLPKTTQALHRQWLRLPSTRCSSTLSKIVFPDPPSSNHHDLTSFLAYAERVGLGPKSTVYVGTRYEYTVQQSLQTLGFTLQRTGGASDNGIDLLGTWRVPTREEPVRVIVQCKALARKLNPATARELEGAFAGAPASWREPGVLALLVSPRSSTKGVREALGRSRWPMGFAMCTTEGKVLQLLWNRTAEEHGLLGLGVDLKYAAANGEQEVMLTWNGQPVQALDGV